MNQCKQIANYIKTHGEITQLHATMYIGCTSLHRRLSDMREMGYVIGNKWLIVQNRCGDNVRVKLYWIIKQPRKAK